MGVLEPPSETSGAAMRLAPASNLRTSRSNLWSILGRENARHYWLRPTCPTCPAILANPYYGMGPRCIVQEGDPLSFLVVSFYLIGFLVGHPGQVGPLQQNQALLASNLRSGAWTPWTGLLPHQCRWRPLVTNLYDWKIADHAPSPTAAD